MGLVSRDRFYGSDYVICLHGVYWHEALARHTSSYKVPSVELLWAPASTVIAIILASSSEDHISSCR
ncbi:hypothetical protein HETIRDRAFT_122832 [Heterobasidion irregulare TC 32-1]|uniref:Uncharacterized protein n=1 Tax=Heterobasidion irregulare (strain TC 32-1) TaxID=747525 RepID=W4KB04_HETIT|nr:uncharacterized protein HETIRDRAFT_122832 [Heterobasidion irregulare TC 32-1]ETW82251.1 hypothetical protein HETIRDRAFT_122832 [Heterobasidion irregulare TC 32-1]